MYVFKFTVLGHFYCFGLFLLFWVIFIVLGYFYCFGLFLLSCLISVGLTLSPFFFHLAPLPFPFPFPFRFAFPFAFPFPFPFPNFVSPYFIIQEHCEIYVGI
jgi:hypothetical protein